MQVGTDISSKCAKRPETPHKGRKKNSSIEDICPELFLGPSWYRFKTAKSSNFWCQLFSNCRPPTNSNSITLVFIKSAYSWALPQTYWRNNSEWGQQSMLYLGLQVILLNTQLWDPWLDNYIWASVYSLSSSYLPFILHSQFPKSQWVELLQLKWEALAKGKAFLELSENQ